jgi:hypothetical protein
MVHVKVAEPVAPVLSVAVTVTEQVQVAVGVPVTLPVPLSMASPAGSPVADQEVIVAWAEESDAELLSVVIAVPTVPLWAPGLATVTVLWTVQVKVAAPLTASVSVTVMVTG